MAITIHQIHTTYSTAPQINEADIPEIAALGFRTIINNRPDHEGGDQQPSSQSLKEAAERAGLAYYHIPVTPNNITPEAVVMFKSALEQAPKPILGFCRTGNRAAKMLELAQNNESGSQL